MFNLKDFEGEEKHMLEELTDSLRRRFPNPKRIECPNSRLLEV